MKEKKLKHVGKRAVVRQSKQKRLLMTSISKQPSKTKTKKKNALLGQIADKIAGVLKKPFIKKDSSDQQKVEQKKRQSPFKKKDPSKKRRLPGQKTDEELKQQVNEDEELKADESSNRDYAEAKAQAEHPASQFFYSDEKFVAAFEDDDITKTISTRYPQFTENAGKNAIMKKTIISILEDEDFMDSILKMYNMSIYDFFKYLYRVDSNLFHDGNFISRIQTALKRKKYAKVRLPDYKFRRVQRAMAAARKRVTKRKS